MIPTDRHDAGPDDTGLLAELRGALDPQDPTTASRLHARLVHDAEADGLVDVAYRTVESPFGPLLVAATVDGVVRVAFDREDHDTVLTTLARTVSPRILRAPRRLDETSRQLEDYLGGRRRTFDIPVDLRLAQGFRRRVLDHLRAIPYGTTETYRAVAAGAGNPEAVRAAGTACARNPLPLIIPCHRVVRSDGSIGQYLGGTETKEALLTMETAR